MTRVAFDTNVLLYAALEPMSAKGLLSRALTLRGAGNGVIAVQALGEYLRKMQRHKALPFATAIDVVQRYTSVFTTPANTASTMAAAAELARDHKLQIWDCVIIVASASAGATVLLSEDMQDGRAIGGLRIINPFSPANVAAVDALFPV